MQLLGDRRAQHGLHRLREHPAVGKLCLIQVEVVRRGANYAEAVGGVAQRQRHRAADHRVAGEV